MHFSFSALVLSTLAIGQATAASISHGKMHSHAARHAELMEDASPHRAWRRDNGWQTLQNNVNNVAGALLNDADSALLKTKSVLAGTNSAVKGATAWVGSDGQWTADFTNESGKDCVAVIWGNWGSWVNNVAPHLTLSLPNNATKTVSFPDGYSGAWAPLYSDSVMFNGQIKDTWGEATFKTQYSVFDVSREVNMNGRSMKIVGPQCTSDMNTCVFKCGTQVANDQCTYGYQLVNCATGSQAGAWFGTYGGADSGGCGGNGQTSGHISVHFQ